MCISVFKGQSPHNLLLCLKLPSHSHLRTQNELPCCSFSHISRRHLQFCGEEGRDGVSSVFCAALRCAEVSQIDPWLQSRQLTGAADIELSRSTPPRLDLWTNSSTGALLKQWLQTETLSTLKNVNYCHAGADTVCKDKTSQTQQLTFNFLKNIHFECAFHKMFKNFTCYILRSKDKKSSQKKTKW